jgi:hypothetical protein
VRSNVPNREEKRPRYRVTLILKDGSKTEEVVYADSPDHARKKAVARYANRIIVEVLAEEEKK